MRGRCGGSHGGSQIYQCVYSGAIIVKGGPKRISLLLQKMLNFLREMQSVTVNYRTLYLVRQLIRYSHSIWVTNTVCSLFRYFFIILSAAYSVYVRFSLEFFVVFKIVWFKNFHKIVLINSLGSATVTYAADRAF